MLNASSGTPVRWLWLLMLLICGRTSLEGQINAWTNGSANWEDPHWTLGIPPGAGQSIYLTNQGFKAVAITSTNSSASLTVSSINLWADNNSFNLLLLNYSGFEKPLTTGVLNISTNGVVTSLYATLNVTGAVTIDGALNQGESAQVNAGSISVGTTAPPAYNLNQIVYNLTNGTLQITGNLTVGGLGAFNQFGGSQTNGGIELIGFDPQRTPFGIASFSLNGGVVSTPSITLDWAGFTQAGGTNQVRGDVTVSSRGGVSTFNLNGGLLTSSNTTVVVTGIGGVFYQSLFSQSAGVQIVTNLLRISEGPDNGSGYIQTGGQLIAPTIQVDTGAAFHHNGGTVSNANLLTLGGQGSAWDENTGGQQMGRLLLGNYASTLSLPSFACALRFANSSGVLWSNLAMLTIENWNGSRMGGGQHQIYFGSNAAGLTAGQVSQIQFHNPAGFSGFLPAVILSTGEIVPFSIIQTIRLGNALVLEFPSGATLQTATNVTGPYTDIATVSPYTNLITGPLRFFRTKN